MAEIALRTVFSATVDQDEVRKVLDSALRHEAGLASARRACFERLCRAFAQQYQMTSDEFMHQFESGDLGDEAPYFDWYAAKRGFDLWERRFQILSGVRVRARATTIQALDPSPLFPTIATTIKVELTRLPR